MDTRGNQITVVITAYNEEDNIQECIKSAFKLSKKVILVDTESTDLTKQRAEDLGIQVFSYPFSQYVEPSRNFAISKVDTDWVFILDADERITDKAVDEIKHRIDNSDKSHYLVPRKNIIAKKKWLKYGGWYPDYIIRLIRKSDFNSWPSEIHSTPIISGAAGKLLEPLNHYFQPSLEYMVNKTAVYEDMESSLLLNANKKVSTLILFRKFFGEISRRLILKKGFLDGTYGIIESLYQAFSKTITYIFLYEKNSTAALKFDEKYEKSSII